MIPKSEVELRITYRDLLDDDSALIRMAQILDAGYGMVRAPLSLHQAAPRLAPGDQTRDRRRTSWTSPLRLRLLPAVAALATVVALLLVNVTLALPNITDLGRPLEIESTNAYFPLSGFHRVPLNVRQHGKPELLFLGALGTYYDRINAERWPLVKALDQFGRLSGVGPLERTCPKGTLVTEPTCTVPSFDLSHERYTSPYLTFVSKDLVRDVISTTGRTMPTMRPELFQRLSRTELAIFNRYARVSKHPVCELVSLGNGNYVPKPCKTFADVVGATIVNTKTTKTLPLIATGGYLQTTSVDLSPSDLESWISLTSIVSGGVVSSQGSPSGLPFRTVKSALIDGKDPQGTHLVENVNAETNIITALICHADGKRPTSVCTRPAIKDILKSVK